MDWTLVALGGFLIVVAFFGCIVPCVPGPLLGWCALLALAFSRFAIPTAWLVAAGVVMAVVTVLDYIVPAYGAKKFQCTRWGIFGCTDYICCLRSIDYGSHNWRSLRRRLKRRL